MNLQTKEIQWWPYWICNEYLYNYILSRERRRLLAPSAPALRHPRSRSPRFNPKESWLGIYWRNVDLLRGGTLPYLLELLSRDFLLWTCFIRYWLIFTFRVNKSPRFCASYSTIFQLSVGQSCISGQVTCVSIRGGEERGFLLSPSLYI